MSFLYSHPQNPAARFRCDQRSEIPAWACDIEAFDVEINLYGLPAHPSDELVHWSDANPKAKCLSLRACWDALEQAGLLPQALEIAKASRQIAESEAAEAAAGESI